MGRGRGHKGGAKQFTNPEKLEERKEKEEKERAWRKKRGELEDSSDEEESGESVEGSSSDEEGSGDAASSKAKKGAEPLIEIHNPNRVVKKAPKKDLTDIEETEVQLSRREREEIEKQKAKEHYARLTAEGKTEQARADLARLAIIRQQREEAARKKEDERKAREAAKQQAAIGKIAATRSVASEFTVTANATSKSKGKKKS